MIDILDWKNPVPDVLMVKPVSLGQQYNPQSSVTPMCDTMRNPYMEDLQWRIAKEQIYLEKNKVFLQQRLEYEGYRDEKKLRNSLRREMISYEIYEDSLGRMIYLQIGLDNEDFFSKILLNVTHYNAIKFKTFFPEECTVIAISWDECNAKPLYFKVIEDGISLHIFRKKLRGKGIVFRISKRRESDLVEALLAYSLNTEKVYEIPFQTGWNVMSNGKWHFAKNDEITMNEILKNV